MPKLTYEVIRRRTQKYEEIWDRDYAHCMVCGNPTLYTNKAGGSCDVQYACVYCCVMFSAEEPASLVPSAANAALLDKLRELDAQEHGTSTTTSSPRTPSQETYDRWLEKRAGAKTREAIARGLDAAALLAVKPPTANLSAAAWLREAAAKARAGVFEDKTAYATTQDASLTSQDPNYARAKRAEPEPAVGLRDQDSASTGQAENQTPDDAIRQTTDPGSRGPDT